MGDPASTTQSDLEALERFVVDNDDLLTLEERIGRFNIFDALGIARTEIRHSNFLAWLLDPNESHGQGSLFLKAVLMDLLRQAPVELRPLSPVELDGEELRGVEIRREWRNIDLLITCKEPAFVIAIENKIDSGEHSDQLGRYQKTVKQEFGDQKTMYVFLTTDGDEPSSDEWVPYGYADIHRTLTRCRAANAGAIGGDVAAFLDHYLRLIGSQFMDDPKIDELCQRIYKNHRQAIGLILDRGSIASPGIEALARVVESDSRFRILFQKQRFLEFIPKTWDVMPPRESYEGPDRPWIKWGILIDKGLATVFTEVGPAHDAVKRSKIVGRLCEVEKQFDFKLSRRQIKPIYTRLCSKTFVRWRHDEEEMPEEKAVTELKQLLDAWEIRLRGIPDVLRPIFTEWEKSKT